jgi:hypothetical protein
MTSCASVSGCDRCRLAGTAKIHRVAQVTIENPILNSAFDAPGGAGSFRYGDEVLKIYEV